MAPNPFYEGEFGIKEPRHFGGRANLQSEFKEVVLRQGADRLPRIWAVTGQPSMGKTSVGDWCIFETQKLHDDKVVLAVSIKLESIEGSDTEKLSRAELLRCVYASIIHDLWKLNASRTRTGKPPILSVAQHSQMGVGWAWRQFYRVPFFQPWFPLLSNSAAGMKWILRFLRRCKIIPTSVVIVVDDILPKHYDAIFGLAKGITSFDKEIIENDAALTLILLMQPNWEEHLRAEEHKGVDRRIDSWALAPFSDTDTTNYIVNRLAAGNFGFEDDVPEQLFAASGGIPLLINMIGNAAAKRARNSRVSLTDVEAVIDEAVGERTLLGRKALSLLRGTYEIDFGVLSSSHWNGDILKAIRAEFDERGRMNLQDAVGVGYPRDVWEQAIQKRLDGKQFREAFSDLWNYLQSREFLIASQGGYRLASGLLFRILVSEASK